MRSKQKNNSAENECHLIFLEGVVAGSDDQNRSPAIESISGLSAGYLKDSVMELKKAAPAIHIASKNGRLSFLQRKIGNILLYNAYTDLLVKEIHAIRVRDLAESVGFNSNDYDLLKSSLKQLRNIAIEWNVLNVDGREKWGVSSMIAEAQIENGMITYSYPPMLRKLLYNPEIFARIDLRVQKRFSGNYALSLYENCYRFKSAGTTGVILLGTWKKLIGVEAGGTYELFKNLNRKIIKPAVEEINAVSDIQVTVEYIKEGRKVIGLQFVIAENPRFLPES
jgi:Initiator Replication protein